MTRPPLGRPPAWAAVVILLLVANIVWMGWSSFRQCSKAGAGNELTVSKVHTNDANGVIITDTRTGEPVWAKWDLDRDGKPDTISCFFEGNPAMNIYLREGSAARREVIFYGETGKPKISWADRSGSGIFTERILYDTSTPQLQIWYGDAWWPTVEKDHKRGIILGGEWHHLQITNGVWVPEGSPALNPLGAQPLT